MSHVRPTIEASQPLPTRRFGVLLIVGLMQGCAPAPLSEPAPPADAGGGCPVIGEGRWSAAIIGAGGTAELEIVGTVDLPTPGYTLALVAGPADRAMPPGQRFTLSTSPPTGITAAVVTATRVSYRNKAAYPAYRQILIRCGNRVLATIADITPKR